MLNESLRVGLKDTKDVSEVSKPKKPKKMRITSLADLKVLRDAMSKSLHEGEPAKVKGVK